MINLSVIVPCYNLESYLAQTIRSLQQNTAGDVEFVLVNDCSEDNTGDMLETLSTKLAGSRVIHNEQNVGLAATRNVGTGQAAGTYITYLDGDDFVAPGYYPELLKQITRLGCEMIRTDHIRVTGRRRTIHRIPHGPRGVVSRPRDAILPTTRTTSVDMPNAWSGIYHRDLMDRGLLHFTEHFRTCEDRPWNWRLHLGAESFAVIGLLGLFYRREVTGSLTQISDTRQFDFLKAFDQIVADVMADPDSEALLPKALRSYCAMVCYHLSRSHTYEPDLAVALRTLCASGVRRLPRGELTEVITSLDPKRQRVIEELLDDAA